jgi:hypothetical protein
MPPDRPGPPSPSPSSSAIRRGVAGGLLAVAAAAGTAAVLAGPLTRPSAADAAWAGGPSPAGLEACCLPDGGCVEVPAGNSVCVELLGGTLMGPGTDCVTAACDGACCLPEDGACIEGVGPATCGELGGLFAGLGTDCEPSPCVVPRGACCLPDGSCVDDVTAGLCVLTLGGVFNGGGSACRASVCCRGDVTGDGRVDFEDALRILSDWGACSPALACEADLDRDETVGFGDLTIVLANFGCD